MADITFIMRSSWLDYIAALPLDQRDKILAEIVRYGTEQPMEYANDPVVSSFVNMVKANIDYSKDRYEKKVHGGRPQKVTDEMIAQGIREGKTAATMAKEFGCDASTITKREVWKHRKDEDGGIFEF